MRRSSLAFAAVLFSYLAAVCWTSVAASPAGPRVSNAVSELAVGTRLFQQASYDAAVTRLEHAVAIGLELFENADRSR